jgi:hypothetical protein
MIGDHDGKRMTTFIAARIAEEEITATAADDKQLLVTLWAMRDMAALLGKALARDPYVPIPTGWAEMLIMSLVQRWRTHPEFRLDWRDWTETEQEKFREIRRGPGIH